MKLARSGEELELQRLAELRERKERREEFWAEVRERSSRIHHRGEIGRQRLAKRKASQRRHALWRHWNEDTQRIGFPGLTRNRFLPRTTGDYGLTDRKTPLFLWYTQQEKVHQVQGGHCRGFNKRVTILLLLKKDATGSIQEKKQFATALKAISRNKGAEELLLQESNGQRSLVDFLNYSRMPKVTNIKRLLVETNSSLDEEGRAKVMKMFPNALYSFYNVPAPFVPSKDF